MVEQGERLEPNLELQALLDREVLEHGEIDGLRARAVKQVAAGIPVREIVWRDRIQIRNRESGRVDASDQMSASAVGRRGVHQVRAVGAGGGRIRSVG